jgi:hypothetical protein
MEHRATDHRLWWKPGQFGRGLISPEGIVHTWPEDEMTHAQRLMALGVNHADTRNWSRFSINLNRSTGTFGDPKEIALLESVGLKPSISPYVYNPVTKKAEPNPNYNKSGSHIDGTKTAGPMNLPATYNREACPRCGGAWKDADDDMVCSRCGYSIPYDGAEQLEGWHNPFGWAMDTFGHDPSSMVNAYEEGWGPKHFGGWDSAKFSEYMMNHRPGAPSDAEEATAAPMHDLTRVFPDDIYTHPHYYFHDREHDPESYQAALKTRGNPDAPVQIYRAAPVGELNPGDWITPNKTYAEQHAMHPHDPAQDMPVWNYTVPAHTLWQNGDSLSEYGYHGPAIKSRTAASATDIFTCGVCGSHAMTEPKKLGNQWTQICTACGRSRNVPGTHPLINALRTMEPEYPALLNEVGPQRPMNYFGGWDCLNKGKP